MHEGLKQLDVALALKPMMRRSCALTLLALIVFLAALRSSYAGGVPGLIAQELPDIVARLMPAVVNISVLKTAGSDPTDSPDQIIPDRAQGSGFVISAEGLIVTNRHVVENGYSVTVSFADGATYPASVLSTNQRPDLALLKIDAGKAVPFVEFGDSDALRIGETVMAIGNPLGLTSSLSVGVVSAVNRDVNLTMIDDFIQTDAAINHGNSGGPLFNLRGQVVGVNSALFAPGQQSGSAGLGLAIPSNDAAWIIDEMQRFGRMKAGFAGLRLQQVTADLQTAMGLPSRFGNIVTRIIPDTPAAKAGFMEGDVILALNGRESRDVRAFLRKLSSNLPGTQVSLTFWRNGTIRITNLELAPWPNNVFDPAGPQPSHPQRRMATNLGLTLAVTKQRRADDPYAPTIGPTVQIVGVNANSTAADLRLVPGDEIIRVGQDRVNAPTDVFAKIDQARIEGRKDVAMLVLVRGSPNWIVVPIAAR